MKTKTWCIVLVAALAATLLLFGGIMYWLDPMLHYGAESGPLTSYEYAEMYLNPGIARHYQYDTVLVGTSMVENTSVDQCDALFGCNMVRLPYSGGTTYNMKTILDVCFASGNDIRTVYWELDEFQLTGSATEPRYPLPMYLYQDTPLGDLSYLLNMDIFYHYALKDIWNTLRGNVQPAERRGNTLGGTFNREAMLAAYDRPPQTSQKTAAFAGSLMQTRVDENLANMRALMDAHPDTEFVVFLPPFSVLYWDRELRNGTFDAVMDSLEYAMEQLLRYDQVRLYFYQGETEIIENLDHYKDFSHYGPWINDWIIESIAQEHGRVTQENYVQCVEALRTFIHEYDFEAIFAQTNL